MNTRLEEKLKAKAREISIKEGSAYGVSDGFGLRYVAPYALALGANNAQIGVLSSLPNLFGNFSQVYASKAMERFSRKKIVFACVLMQAVMWLSLIGLGVSTFIFDLTPETRANLVIVAYTLIILFGGFLGPVWSSWMRDLVTKSMGKYFGVRNRIVGFVALISMLVAGFVLDYSKGTTVFLGFGVLFFVAFVARTVSAFLLLEQHEPKFVYMKGSYFSLMDFLRRMPKTNFGRFTIFVALVNLATAIASPFFTVYMLGTLKFSYVYYIIVIMSSTLTTLLFMPVWGKFADLYGNMRVVKICSFFIPAIPFLWIASVFIPNPEMLLVYLVIIEGFSGFAWAGFNLSAGVFIYDAVTRQKMALCVSYFNVLNAVGIFIGALLGGFVSSQHFVFFGLTPLLFVFLLSGVARLVVPLGMIGKIREVREVKELNTEEVREWLSVLSPEQRLRIRR